MTLDAHQHSLTLATDYLAEVRKRLGEDEAEQFARAHGASPEELQRLVQRYPQCPPALIGLLQQVDGTHWREYPGGEIAVPILGSDVVEYPYYLRSVAQILEDSEAAPTSIAQIYEDYLDEDPELLGAGIDAHAPLNRRLCFAYCINNGGTSQLYVDFDPAPGGVSGQVVRYLHDPDSYKVIASDFNAYLHTLHEAEFDFIFED